MLDRIGQMDLNEISSIDIIGFSKSLKKEWHDIYELLTWKCGKIASNNWIWIDYTVVILRWVVIANTVTKKILALSV